MKTEIEIEQIKNKIDFYKRLLVGLKSRLEAENNTRDDGYMIEDFSTQKKSSRVASKNARLALLSKID